jgi:predicted PurR-regulated permease PerM
VRNIGIAIVVVFGLAIAVPLIIRLVDALFAPVVIGVVLYLAMRITNARLDRW